MSWSSAEPQTIDGHSFPSKLEARRYVELRLLQKGGLVRGLELQKEFRIEINGVLICKYIADFCFEEKRVGWKQVVEDTKGRVSEIFTLKKKLMWAVHGVDVRIVVAAGGESTRPLVRKIPSRKIPKRAA